MADTALVGGVWLQYMQSGSPKTPPAWHQDGLQDGQCAFPSLTSPALRWLAAAGECGFNGFCRSKSGYCWWKKSGWPVDMINIPLFTGFPTCQVVQDFWTINSRSWSFWNMHGSSRIAFSRIGSSFSYQERSWIIWNLVLGKLLNTLHSHWKWMVGIRSFTFWDGLFSGTMLVSGRVIPSPCLITFWILWSMSVFWSDRFIAHVGILPILESFTSEDLSHPSMVDYHVFSVI